jgi:hypothetical protein
VDDLVHELKDMFERNANTRSAGAGRSRMADIRAVEL